MQCRRNPPGSRTPKKGFRSAFYTNSYHDSGYYSFVGLGDNQWPVHDPGGKTQDRKCD